MSTNAKIVALIVVLAAAAFALILNVMSVWHRARELPPPPSAGAELEAAILIPEEQATQQQGVGRNVVAKRHIRAVSLAEVWKATPFVATVTSISVQTNEGPYTVQRRGAEPQRILLTFTHMVIRLRKEDGTEMAITELHADSNAVAFAAFLREGERYEFPTVLREWTVTHTER